MKERLTSPSKSSQFATFRAASVGDLDIVDILVKQGADINIKETNYGKTAEKIAEELAYANIFNLLRK